MRTVTRMLAVAGVAAFMAGSAQAAAVLSIFQSDGNLNAIPCESGGCSSVNLLAPGNVTFDVFMTVGLEGLSSYGSDVLTSGAGVAVSAVNVGIFVPAYDVNCPGTQACSLSQLGPPVLTGDSIGVGPPNGLNLATLGNGPIGGTYRVARVVFTMNAISPFLIMRIASVRSMIIGFAPRSSNVRAWILLGRTRIAMSLRSAGVRMVRTRLEMWRKPFSYQPRMRKPDLVSIASVSLLPSAPSIAARAFSVSANTNGMSTKLSSGTRSVR